MFATLAIALVLFAGGSVMVSNAPRQQTGIRRETKSITRNLSNKPKQQQYQTEIDLARKIADIDDVPLDVRESMDPHLIDFVVGGFPKCGTTYLQNKILYPSKRVFIPHHETHFLSNDLYDEFKNEFANVTELAQAISKPLLSGYKSPFELGHQKSLRNLQTLFPDVRMIIALRHPILAFESLYNYKLRKLPELIGPVENFIGNCLEGCASSPSASPSGDIETRVTKKSSQRCLENVTFCTGNVNYHQYLSRLGLTPMNTSEELYLLDHHHMSIHHFPGWQKESIDNSSQQKLNDSGNGRGNLFLIELGQEDNRADQSMADDLVSDLEEFLGLDTGDLPRAPHREGDKKPKPVYEYPPGREEYVLDICLDRYKSLREILLETSRKASKWIMEYLLHPTNHDRVIVSNIDIFQRMVEGWTTDPCSNEDE